LVLYLDAMTSDKNHAEYELNTVVVPAQTNTAKDDEDMQRMGKKQSFQVSSPFARFRAL
jgi:hypothetical protein